MSTREAATPNLPTSGLDWAYRLLFGERDPGRDVEAEAYLVVPSARNPRLLLPRSSRRAASAALARNHDATTTKARLAKAVIAAGLRLGVAQRLFPRVVVFVPRDLPADERPDVLLSEHLRGVYSRRDLELAVLLGTPRLNRKPVLQVLSSAGEVLGYVKAAWNDLTCALVRNEARVLTDLAEWGPRSFAAPGPVHHGPWGPLELLATTALPHTRRPAEAAFEPPMAVIGEIATMAGTSKGPLAESAYWSGVHDRLADRASALGEAVDPLAPIVGHIEARFGAEPLRYGTWHGDFTPWNMARLDRGVFLWDWERSSPAPVGLDLLHFLFQSVCRFEGRRPARSVEICRERTPSLLPSLGVPLDSEAALWSVYWLELLFRYDEARLAGVLERKSQIHLGILEMFEREMEAR